MHKIRVKINKKGQVNIKVEGISGPGCKALTKALESALGDTTGDKNTEEHYKATTNNQQGQSIGSGG
jgi:hypothetical protein